MDYREVILESEKLQTIEFLTKFNLKLEDDVSYTINCFDNNQIVGTISCSSNIIKCMAVDSSYQGESIALSLVSKIVQYLYSQNYSCAFVFTKPKNKDIFISMGFKEIVTTSNTVLLELHSDITEELLKIKNEHNLNKLYAAIVVNCNPMTNGHLYLIEKCATENDNVIVFVVCEDKSYFEFEDRFAIVKKECEKFSNVCVVSSTQYLISSKTLPTYFYKDDVDSDLEGMQIDLQIFKKYFLPIFNIKVRYVGEEPYNTFTKNYNETMKMILPNVVEIERIKSNDLYISATHVRKLIASRSIEELKKIVPQSTFELIMDKYITL